MAAKGGGLAAVATANVGNFLSGMTKMLGSMSAVTTGVGLLGAAFVYLGVTQIAKGLEAVREFEKEMTRLETLVGLSAQQVQGLTRSVLDLAPALGTAPTELAQALFAITSGGERSAKAVELLEQSAKAARIGMGDMTSIARVATAAMQAYAGSGLSAEQAIDTMVATVREGNLVAEELSTAFGRVIGIASTMGVSFQEVGAFIATFTRLGVNAEISATSLRAALTAILNPGKEARDTFKAIGTSVEEVRRNIQQNGLTDAFIELLEAAQGNQDVIGNLLPNVRALSGVLGTAGVQSKQYVEITKSVNNSLGVTNEAFARVERTVDDAINDIKAHFETFKVELGRSFVAPVTASLNVFESVLGAVLEPVADGLNLLGAVMTLNSEAAAEYAKDLLMLGQAFEEVENKTDQNRERLMAYSAEALAALRDEYEARINVIGAMMKTDRFAQMEGSRQRALHAQFSQLHALLRMITTEEQRRAAGLAQQTIPGITVMVGMTEEQREAGERMLQTLRDNLMEEKGLNRELFIEKVNREGVTGALRTEIIAAYDRLEAYRKEQEAIKRIAKFWEDYRQRASRRINQVRREGARERRDSIQREREWEMMMRQIVIDGEMRMLEERNARLQDAAESMSQTMTEAALSIIEDTKNIGKAFEEMVTKILMEIARLKIEKAILDGLMSILVPIPNAPDAIPTPEIDVSGYGMDFATESMFGAARQEVAASVEDAIRRGMEGARQEAAPTIDVQSYIPDYEGLFSGASQQAEAYINDQLAEAGQSMGTPTIDVAGLAPDFSQIFRNAMEQTQRAIQGKLAGVRTDAGTISIDFSDLIPAFDDIFRDARAQAEDAIGQRIASMRVPDMETPEIDVTPYMESFASAFQEARLRTSAEIQERFGDLRGLEGPTEIPEIDVSPHVDAFVKALSDARARAEREVIDGLTGTNLDEPMVFPDIDTPDFAGMFAGVRRKAEQAIYDGLAAIPAEVDAPPVDFTTYASAFVGMFGNMREQIASVMMDSINTALVPDQQMFGAADILGLNQRLDVAGAMSDATNGGMLDDRISSQHPPTIVQQNIEFNPGFVDGDSGQRWLREQAGTIVAVVGDAAQRSVSAARMLRGVRSG